MIEKMKFITLTGPKDDIDRVTRIWCHFRSRIHTRSSSQGSKTLRTRWETLPQA